MNAQLTRSRQEEPELPAATEAAALLAPGTAISHFRVKRCLASGGMGSVYLARDAVLGRTVALKLVRRERFGPVASQELLEEARMTAQLAHPNVVTVYAVGEHEGQLWVALEHLSGGSLRERMEAGRMTQGEALRTLLAIAEGLAHAHAQGVLHRDLKPANVMLPNDGRPRIVDFGLASLVGEGAGSTAGTPLYMAPEQWRGEPLTPAVDVWAFGLIARELLLGVHPLPNYVTREELSRLVCTTPLPPLGLGSLPEALRRALDRATALRADERPTAAELAAAIDQVLRPSIGVDVDDTPFRGLAPFTEATAHLFTGRDAEVDLALERLRERALLLVVGPSGAGKTSFVRAGLVPRLLEPGKDRLLRIRPGADPFRALSHAFSSAARQGAADDRGSWAPIPTATEETGVVRRRAEAWRARLGQAVHEILVEAHLLGGRVVVYVDQLEELFTQCREAATRAAFLELLRALADDPLEPIRVVASVRDDFIGELSGFDDVLVLGPLDAKQAERAIREPVERAGYGFDDPTLPARMAEEVGGKVSTLPLLQFTARRLWERRDVARRVLSGAVYAELGGVGGALAQHAEGTVAAMPPLELAWTEELLVRLVSSGGHRRTLAERELLDGLPPEAARVLARLVDARLLAVRRDPEHDSRMVELTHESLVTRWARLEGWLSRSRDERRIIEELDAAARLWDARGRRVEETWSGNDVEIARARLGARVELLATTTRDFLDAGRARAFAERKRRRTVLTTVVVGLSLAVAVASFVALEFRARERVALEQAERLAQANANLGRFGLELRPFEWDPSAFRARPARPGAVKLGITLHAAVDAEHPGRELPPPLVRVTETGTSAATPVFDVEAPGGRAFLEVRRQRADGVHCAPSWVRLENLPGFDGRVIDPPPRFTIPVPTCEASSADLIEIPAGPVRVADEDGRFRTTSVDAFALDRTEVPSALFSVFTRLERISGYPAPRAPAEGLIHDALGPRAPAAAIDALTASAFCRFMGKRLPSRDEWRKAARGGELLDGRANPDPERIYPWVGPRDDTRVNLLGPDRFALFAPVDALRDGAGPYGHLALVGNQAEWTNTPFHPNDPEGLRVVVGGAWDIEAAIDLHRIDALNGRDPRFFNWAIGVRCAR